jgi:hypothetical protein
MANEFAMHTAASARPLSEINRTKRCRHDGTDRTMVLAKVKCLYSDVAIAKHPEEALETDLAA